MSCARRSPDETTKDPGSIPGTSTKRVLTRTRSGTAHRGGAAFVSGLVDQRKQEVGRLSGRNMRTVPLIIEVLLR